MAQPRMSDEAVKKASGKDWKQWFTILDKAGAKQMKHRDIARWIHDHYLSKKGKNGINVATSGGWWSQMVTVEYERARGMREVHEQGDGFLVAMHKTVSMPLSQLEKEWAKIEQSKAVASKKLERTPSKTKRNMLRYKVNGIKGAGSRAFSGLVVSFDERGAGKSRIMVEAIRLEDKEAVEKERAFWKKVLATF